MRITWACSWDGVLCQHSCMHVGETHTVWRYFICQLVDWSPNTLNSSCSQVLTLNNFQLVIYTFPCTHPTCLWPNKIGRLCCELHKIIHTHSSVLWDWQYFTKYSSHSIWIWGIFYKILSVPLNTTMGLNDVTVCYNIKR